MAENEKLGQKYQATLRIAKEYRVHTKEADDCLVQRETQHKWYTVATVAPDLTGRIQKIPGFPIMDISNHR